MHDTRRLANLLGAAGLAVADLAVAASAREVGLSTSAAAALVVLSASGELSVTELGRRVALSQSAAARMVDGVAAAGLVERLPGVGRSVPVRVTAAGEQTVQAVLAAREAPLTDVLAGFDTHQHELLEDLLTTLLDRLYARVGDSELLCRLCDRRSCTTGATCPVGAAERRAAR